MMRLFAFLIVLWFLWSGIHADNQNLLLAANIWLAALMIMNDRRGWK